MNLNRCVSPGLVLLAGLLVWWTQPLTAAESLPRPQIEFLDRYVPGATIYQKDPGVIPWTEEDQQSFRQHWGWLQKRAPGLVRRATAYRTIRVYRVAEVKEGTRTLVARYLDHSMFIDDRFMGRLRENPGYQPQLLNPIAHECGHLHDSLYRYSWSKEWVDLVQPRIARIHQRFEEQTGMKLGEFLWLKPEQREPAWNRLLTELARDEGLTRGYGGLNLQESLADSIGYVALGSRMPQPQEIKDFVASHFTSLPWEPEPVVRLIHQGFAALYEGRADEAVSRFSEVLAREPGNIMVHEVRGVAYRMRRDNELAIADFTRVIERGPALHSESLRQRAMLYLQKRDWTRAATDCQRLLQEAAEPETRAWAMQALERMPQ